MAGVGCSVLEVSAAHHRLGLRRCSPGRAHRTPRRRLDEHDDGVLDLACVPDRVRDVFSHRSVQVDAKLADLIGRWTAENEGADPAPRTIAHLERTAVRTSRPANVHGLDPASWWRRWDSNPRLPACKAAQRVFGRCCVIPRPVSSCCLVHFKRPAQQGFIDPLRIGLWCRLSLNVATVRDLDLSTSGYVAGYVDHAGYRLRSDYPFAGRRLR